MGNLGFQEILLIAVVVLVLFSGRQKYLNLLKGLGRGVREFNDAKNNVRKSLKKGLNEKDNQPPSPSANGVQQSTTTTTQP